MPWSSAAKRREYSREYYQSHQKYFQEYSLKYRKTKSKGKHHRTRAKVAKSPSRRLSLVFSNSVRRGLVHGKGGKKTWQMLGYTLDDLRSRLASLFVEGMTWDNYGEWHIDHIIPIGFFVFESADDVEFKMCWRLENLQPLWAADNYRKAAKMPDYSVNCQGDG